MELHFCDLCNESVPQADLDLGRAVRRAGRVVCAACEDAMTAFSSHARGAGPEGDADERRPAAITELALTKAPPPPSGAAGATSPGAPGRREAGSLAAFALATLALVGSAGASAFLWERSRGEGERLSARIEDLREDVQQDSRLLESRVDHQVSRLGATIERQGEDQAAGIDQRLEDLEMARRDELQRLREDVARLVERVDELSGLRTSLDRHERDLAELATTTSELHAELLRVGDQLAGAPAPETSRRPASAPVNGAAASGPEWLSVVAELESQNSGTRWQAVQTLGNTGDPDTAEYLVPMLKDPDIFVRMATARILGDLAAVVGIPALIDALEDPEASVREAAVVSLRAVTGREFEFDPTAREADRSKRVKAWRDWWKKVSKDVLGNKTFERGDG